MNKKIATFLLVLGSAFGGQSVFAGQLSKGQQAPVIPLQMASHTVDLSEFKGEVVYLDFWASWCKPCRRSFPWMNDMHEKYAKQGLNVIAINLDAEPELAAKFLDSVPADFPIAYDAEGKTAQQYQVMGMPSSYLIDRKGMLRAVHQGFFVKSQAKYEREINALLAEKD